MADVKYRDKRKISGWGIIHNSARTQSVRVFYIFETYEKNIGDRFHQIWIPTIDALELDFRGVREPAWLAEPSILETDSDGKFNIRRYPSHWEIIRLNETPTSK